MIDLVLTHLTHPWGPPWWFGALNSLKVMSDEKTWPDQQKDNDEDKYKDKDNDNGKYI